MKIIDIRVHIVRLPTRRDHNWASKMSTPIGQHAIVELRTDDDVTGWGEAPAGATWGGAHMRYYGETPQTVRHIVLDYLATAVSGLSAHEPGVIHERMDK